MPCASTNSKATCQSPCRTLLQTLMLLDPAFDEASLSFAQFQEWLESNSDTVALFVMDRQLVAAPPDYAITSHPDLEPWPLPRQQWRT